MRYYYYFNTSLYYSLLHFIILLWVSTHNNCPNKQRKKSEIYDWAIKQRWRTESARKD